MQVQMKFERYIATLIIAVLFSMLAFPGKSSVGQTAVSKLPPLLHRDLHDYLVEQEIRQQGPAKHFAPAFTIRHGCTVFTPWA